MTKKIEDKYQELSEIQHVLHRSGMWVGSTKYEEKDTFIYNYKTGKFEMKITNYIPAMLKIVDEVISNSIDEFRRKDNMGLTELRVIMNKNNGEIIMTKIDEENGEVFITTQEQLILDLDEKVENFKKCIENIKDILENSEEPIEDIKESIKELENLYGGKL